MSTHDAIMVNQRCLGLQKRLPAWAPVSQANRVRREVRSFGNNRKRRMATRNPMEAGHSIIKGEAGRVGGGGTRQVQGAWLCLRESP